MCRDTKKVPRLSVMGVARADWLFAAFFCVVVPYVLEGLNPYVRAQALDDPSVMHPHLPDIVPAPLLVGLSLFLPVVVFLTSHCHAIDSLTLLTFEAFMLGLVEANGLTVTVTNVLKLFVGRPRPHFAAVCVSYVVGSDSQCSGNSLAVREARKSFPSGHSSLAFASAVYTSAYISSRVSLGKCTQQHRRIGRSQPPSAWKMLLVLFPLLLASLVAASRTKDFHHNYDDIVAGSVIGSTISALVFCNRMAVVMPESSVTEFDEIEAHRPQQLFGTLSSNSLQGVST